MIKKVKIFLLTMGILVLLFAFVYLFFANFNFGVVIIGSGAGVLIVYGLFFEKLIKIKWLTCGISAICAFFFIMAAFIGIYGNTDNADFNEDAIIVLGAGIRGEQVTRTLAYRLNKAAEYSEKNPGAAIVVSGGRGAQENITEALAMEKYLISKGVPAEKIIKEERAASTYENFLYSKEILDGLFEYPYKTAVATNSFHVFRAVKLAGKTGLAVTHCGAKIDWYSVPVNYSRECLAVLKMLILGK
ncbi:MAG: YdcF family protein [Oscillospiraceae bacterium]|nr:YdcF family protein [Oscillospiraceae bacterium]